MKSYEDILERSTNYWKETNRKSYIALYRGERLNTKQTAYLTPGATKRAVVAIITEARVIRGRSYEEQDFTIEDVRAYVDQLIADGIIEIVALEDMIQAGIEPVISNKERIDTKEI